MADEADRADMDIERENEASIQHVRDRAAAIPLGHPGDCDICGEWSGRLVNGACAPCRDKLHLP